MVCQLPRNTLLYDLSRAFIDNLIRTPINSKCGIRLSLDKPLNNDICLNLLRPAVLRQYYGLEIENQTRKSKRYTYGSGSGTSSVGMDMKNFVTRPLNANLLAMIDDIYEILCNNKERFNLKQSNLTHKFNHCTVLLYYAGDGLKSSSTLGYHTDCIYSPVNGEYVEKSNSQLANTPAVIYSIGDTRELNWKCRNIVMSDRGRYVWENNVCEKMKFQLRSDTLTIIHPDDENPRSLSNIEGRRQFLHGGVNVSGHKLSVGYVFRIVKNTAMYNKMNDTMIVENECNDVVNGILGLDIGSYHRKLFNLYCNTLY